MASREESVSFSEDLRSSRASSEAATEQSFTSARRQRDYESVKESSDQQLAILSQWKTIFRDLDAHITLAKSLTFIGEQLKTTESAEEMSVINEDWHKGRVHADTLREVALANAEYTLRSFCIATTARSRH
jgi:hypothetical protein